MDSWRLKIFPAAIPILVLWCFVFYPAWRIIPALTRDSGFGPDVSISLIIAALFSALVILARLTVVTDARVTLSQTPQHASSGWPFAVLLVLILIVFFAFQFPYLKMTLVSTGDEARLVVHQYQQFRALTLSDPLALSAALILCLAVSLLCVFGVGNAHITGLMRFWVCLVLIFAGVFFLAQLTAGFHTEWGQYYRRPPLGILSRLPGFLLFGDTELGVRLGSSLYIAASALCAYGVLASHNARVPGLFAAIACLTSPVFFLHGVLDYRDAAGAFFATLCIFALVRYVQSRDGLWFHLACFAVAAGYLERRPLIVLGLLCALVVAWQLIDGLRRGDAFGKLLRLAVVRGLTLLLPLLVALVWMNIYGERLNTRDYVFHFENFVTVKTLLGYPRILPSLFSWPVLVLVAAGLCLALYRKMSVGWISLGAILLFYVLFTADDAQWVPTQRFAVNFLPALAILAAVSLCFIPWPALRITAVAAFTVLVTFAANSWLNNEPKTIIGYNRKPANLVRLPFNDVAADLYQQIGNEKHKVCVPRAYRSFDFYWFRLSGKRGRGLYPRKRTPENLTLTAWSENCRQRGWEHLLIPLWIADDGAMRIRDVTDIQVVDIKNDSVPGFSVQKIYRNGHHGLALLTHKR